MLRITRSTINNCDYLKITYDCENNSYSGLYSANVLNATPTYNINYMHNTAIQCVKDNDYELEIDQDDDLQVSFEFHSFTVPLKSINGVMCTKANRKELLQGEEIKKLKNEHNKRIALLEKINLAQYNEINECESSISRLGEQLENIEYICKQYNEKNDDMPTAVNDIMLLLK